MPKHRGGLGARQETSGDPERDRTLNHEPLSLFFLAFILLKGGSFFEISPGVRLLRSILMLLLAVAWIPLSAHCELENMIGLEVLQCHPQGPSSGASHCEDAPCCGWECGQYYVPAAQPLVTVPPSAIVPSTLTVREPGPTGGAFPEMPAAAPPDSPRPWQFYLRAAVLPRAPSKIS